MTDLFLTSAAADAAVTAGSGTKWKAAFAAGASATHLNKNSVLGATAPLQMTDGAAGTDGTVVAFYSEPLGAVTIAGQIVCTMWNRENATANNVAPSVRIERCDGTGAVLSTIVAETVNHGAGEMGTTASGSQDIITLQAANVTDTTLVDGDRLRITLWIDDATDQGGVGTMQSGGRGEFWVNGPTASQGSARFAFTEAIGPLPPAPTGTVVYVASSAGPASAFASSINVPVPAGSTTMDVVVVRIGRWESVNPAITSPAGFTKLTQFAQGNQKVDTFVKRLSAPDSGNYAFSWTGSMWQAGIAVLYRGVDRDLDLTTLRINGAGNASTSTLPTTSLNTVPVGSALDWGCITGTTTTHLPPTGWTEVQNPDAAIAAERDNVSAGNYTASGATAAVSSTENVATLVELLPEPAAGGGSQTADAALSGTGTLTASVFTSSSAAAALTGTGTLTASVFTTSSAAATLSGTGTLQATATVTTAAKNIDGALSGTGTLTGTAATTKPVDGALPGTGTLTGAAASAKIVTGALSGTGTLTAAAATTKPVDGTLSGTAALTGAATSAKPVDGALSGAGILGVAAASAKTVDGALSGTGTLQATGSTAATGSADAALSGTGTLTATTTVSRPASGSLAGTGTLTAVGATSKSTGATLTGTGSLVASGTSDKPATANLAGSGALTATAARVAVASASQAGSGTTNATAASSKTVAGSQALTATLSASASTGAGTTIDATLAGTGTRSADATSSKTADATRTGTGSLVAAAVPTRTAVAELLVTGAASSSATVRTTTQAGLVAVGNLTATCVVSTSATAQLVGTGTLVASIKAQASITPRPDDGITVRPTNGRTIRPNVGTSTRPRQGRTIRPYTGTTPR